MPQPASCVGGGIDLRDEGTEPLAFVRGDPVRAVEQERLIVVEEPRDARGEAGEPGVRDSES
jgi:hypothetical protein